MAEQLKTFFSPALVRRLASDIARVHPEFAIRAFSSDATNGLEDLEARFRELRVAQQVATVASHAR